MISKLILSLFMSASCAFAAQATPNSGALKVLALSGDKPADNFKHACGFHKATAAAKNPEAFLKALEETNFDPCCLGPDLLDGLSATTDVVNGVSVGYMTSLPVYEAGKELVMFYRPGQAGVTVAVYHYFGVALEVELPAGNAITRAIVYGACNKPEDYEGYFKTIGALGITTNIGMSSTFLDTPESGGISGLIERIQNHVGSQETGCNSKGLNSGLATSFVGLGGFHYKKISPAVKVTGARARKLQYMLMRANRDAELRRNGLPGKQFDFKSFHQKTCTFDVPQQTWESIDLREVVDPLVR